MVGLKLAIPALMVALGGGALVVAAAADGTAQPAAAQVWIDGPAGLAPLTPGAVTVTAHATSGETIDALVLFVDGDEVAVDDDLERTARLVQAGFPWSATPGVHELVVQQRGAPSVRSMVRSVVVSGGGQPPTDPAVPTTEVPTTTAAGEVTTTSSSTTTTTRPADSIPTDTVAPPEIDDTVPATTAPATTAPPPTTVPRTPPVIAAASISSTNQNRLYTGPCGYTLVVTARVADADGVRVRVEGTGFNRPMSSSGASYSLEIGSGSSVWSAADVGTHRVVVEAVGGGSTVTRAAGTLTILSQCPKD